MTAGKLLPWCLTLMMAALAVFPHEAVAQPCSARVIFANGIVTLEKRAQDIRDILRDDVNQALQDEGRVELPFYCFDYAYASTREQTDELAYFLDLLEAIGQSIGEVFGPFWRWLAGAISPSNIFEQLVQDVFIGVGNISFLTNADLQTQVGQYRSWLETSDKVIIVAHSQGNLFANEAFVVLTSGADGNTIVPPDRLPIVAVATPDNFVAGRSFGSHTTLYGDVILAVPQALPANTDVDGTPCSPTPPESQLPHPVTGMACHDFMDSYLAGDFSWPRIIGQIIGEIPEENSGYSLTDLGVPQGGEFNSRAYAINSSTTVVGTTSGVPDADYVCCNQPDKPFIWTAADGKQVFHPTPSYNGLRPIGGIALGINDQGAVVGALDYGFAGGFRSFIWTAANGMELIPASVGNANDINDAGQVVGSGGGSAYRWTPTGGLESLGISAQYTNAYAINSLGEVAGSHGIESCNTRPQIWNAAGQPQPDIDLSGLLATLPPYSAICSGHASDINDTGDAVGSLYFIFIDEPAKTVAFKSSSQTNSAQGLGELPQIPGTIGNAAYSINNNGMVVGKSGNRAFLWTPETGIQDLNSLLDESGVGWTLHSAEAINEAGEIVGYGLHNGVSRAFLLTPNG